MGTSTHWLERLAQATDYRELQAIFNELAAEARRSDVSPEFCASIDEAIRRIERERESDQKELSSLDGNYAAFKQQQSGFTGWFKRHLPFTETRRQDLRHKAAITDQHAEIAADNLIIARAQILKESLLPPDLRRLGHTAEHWKRECALADGIERLPQYGQLLLQLRKELERSEAFIEELGEDVAAFAKAEFSSEEDNRRKREDVSAAKSELALLQAEIDVERSLFTSGLKRAGEMVTLELSSRDAEFCSGQQRIAQLESCLKLLKTPEKLVGDLLVNANSLRSLLAEREKLNKQQSDLHSEYERLSREKDAADRLCLTANNSLAEYAERFESSKRRCEQSEAAWKAVKEIYDAQADTAGAEVADEAFFNSDPQVAAQHDRLEKEFSVAKEELRIASAPFETAKCQLQQANNNAGKLRSSSDSNLKKQSELTKESHQLESKIIELVDQFSQAAEQLPRLLADYLTSASLLSWRSSLEKYSDRNKFGSSARPPFAARSAFPAHASKPTVPQILEQAEEFPFMAKSIEADARELRQRLTADQNQARQAWTQRSHALLGPEIAELVCR